MPVHYNEEGRPLCVQCDRPVSDNGWFCKCKHTEQMFFAYKDWKVTLDKRRQNLLSVKKDYVNDFLRRIELLLTALTGSYDRRLVRVEAKFLLKRFNELRGVGKKPESPVMADIIRDIDDDDDDDDYSDD